MLSVQDTATIGSANTAGAWDETEKRKVFLENPLYASFIAGDEQYIRFYFD